jgi:probable rRNA maturation factor
MKKQAEILPRISVRNLQRKIAVDRAALERFAQAAIACCLAEFAAALTSQEEIGVLLVSDRRIADLHRRFMDVPGPTDVITFQHGEIFISVDTAQRQAAAFSSSLEQELRLYLVHGLLHLQGFDDRTADARQRMEAAQKRIVAAAGRASPSH